MADRLHIDGVVSDIRKKLNGLVSDNETASYLIHFQLDIGKIEAMIRVGDLDKTLGLKLVKDLYHVEEDRLDKSRVRHLLHLLDETFGKY